MKDKFGSKRGLFNAIKYKLYFLLGFYKQYQEISFDSVDRLVFICSGNICRSPFADYFARSIGLNAISFGLHCKGSNSADPRAIEFARKQGIDMNKHATRNIKNYQPDKGDLHVVMEPNHIPELQNVVGANARITIASLWLNNPNVYLHDPYNTNPVFFENCETLLMKAVSNLKQKMS